ncbi:condensation domain-containing protein [Massilia sp. H-1]|nr:condensation domain-containing protein [Massilia sp. H-1]
MPLTSAQYGIWLGQQLDPSSPAYWTAEAVELTGELDAALFETALRQAIDECDALHQRFGSDAEQVWQCAVRTPWTLARHRMDEQGAHDWMRADLLQVPDLAAGPLFASALLHIGAQRTLWYLRVHHVALDGFGYALLAQRVAALYSALVSGGVPPPPRPARPATAGGGRRGLSRLARLRCGPPVLVRAHAGRSAARPAGPASSARPRRAAAARDAGRGQHRTLDRGRACGRHRLERAPDRRLQRLAAARAGGRDLTIGLPVMGRLGSAALAVPCMAMNIVPLRLQVDPAQTLAQLSRNVMFELRSVRRHQRFRYEHLKQALGMAGGRRRLFGAVINIMPFDRPPAFGTLGRARFRFPAGPVEDLSLTIAPRADGVRCDLEANPAAYDEAAVARLHESLLAALSALTNAPQQPIAQVLPARAAALLSGGPLPAAPQAVLALLAQHAQATPQRIALEQDGAQLTYAALLSQVMALAARLRAHGVRADSRVAVLLPREPRTIVALLAVLWVAWRLHSARPRRTRAAHRGGTGGRHAAAGTHAAPPRGAGERRAALPGRGCRGQRANDVMGCRAPALPTSSTRPAPADGRTGS